MEHPTLLGRPLPIFPCFPNKRPMTPHGYKDATTDFFKFEKMRKQEEYLIGVPTGEISGFDVLDIDEAGIEWSQTELPTIPSRVHITRSGGLHILFNHHQELKTDRRLSSRDGEASASLRQRVRVPAERRPVRTTHAGPARKLHCRDRREAADLQGVYTVIRDY